MIKDFEAHLEHLRRLLYASNCERILSAPKWEVYDMKGEDFDARYFLNVKTGELFTGPSMKDKEPAELKGLEIFYQISQGNERLTR